MKFKMMDIPDYIPDDILDHNDDDNGSNDSDNDDMMSIIMVTVMMMIYNCNLPFLEGGKDIFRKGKGSRQKLIGGIRVVCYCHVTY